MYQVYKLIPTERFTSNRDYPDYTYRNGKQYAKFLFGNYADKISAENTANNCNLCNLDSEVFYYWTHE